MPGEDFFRGYKILLDENGYKFEDTGELVAETWEDRPCGHCNLYNTAEGHDGCLGTIPGALNACCGHGNADEAYIQFPDEDLRGEKALEYVANLTK